MIEMYILMYKTQKNPHLYKDINVEDFNCFLGAKVIKDGGSFKTLRDLLNIQRIMADESGEVIPLCDLYLRHGILTEDKLKSLATIYNP